MAFGLGVLRLPPAAFWAMTPREVAAAAEGAAGRIGRVVPPPRSALEGLMAAYPDVGQEQVGREEVTDA